VLVRWLDEAGQVLLRWVLEEGGTGLQWKGTGQLELERAARAGPGGQGLGGRETQLPVTGPVTMAGVGLVS
jgi:hypothetical protein